MRPLARCGATATRERWASSAPTCSARSSLRDRTIVCQVWLMSSGSPFGPSGPRSSSPSRHCPCWGVTTRPGTLEGYGPIDAQTARRLVSDSPTLQRLLTDPVSGAELTLDRRRYRVTGELRTWLRARDGGCRFPGCGRATRACDVDHTLDWVLDGTSAHNNLAHLCRSHHTLKHASGWNVRQSADRPGDLEWHSPLGRRHETTPAFERIPAAPAWFAGAPPD